MGKRVFQFFSEEAEATNILGAGLSFLCNGAMTFEQAHQFLKAQNIAPHIDNTQSRFPHEISALEDGVYPVLKGAQNKAVSGFVVIDDTYAKRGMALAEAHRRMAMWAATAYPEADTTPRYHQTYEVPEQLAYLNAESLGCHDDRKASMQHWDGIKKDLAAPEKNWTNLTGRGNGPIIPERGSGFVATPQ